MTKLPIAVLFSAILCSTAALADEWHMSKVHVSLIDPTSVPDKVFFVPDAYPQDCNLNPLYWLGKGADTLAKQKNVEAVYSMLLAAQLSNRTVDLYGYQGSCRIEYIYLN
jgi:hypothetical protein